MRGVREIAPLAIEIEIEPWETKNNAAFSQQWIYRFPNGYGASVVCGPYTYGGPAGLYELAGLTVDGDDTDLTYDTPITSDVIGWQSVEEIADLLLRIAALPARSTP